MGVCVCAPYMNPPYTKQKKRYIDLFRIAKELH